MNLSDGWQRPPASTVVVRDGENKNSFSCWYYDTNQTPPPAHSGTIRIWSYSPRIIRFRGVFLPFGIISFTTGWSCNSGTSKTAPSTSPLVCLSFPFRRLLVFFEEFCSFPCVSNVSLGMFPFDVLELLLDVASNLQASLSVLAREPAT